jgi:hypothetical protein
MKFFLFLLFIPINLFAWNGEDTKIGEWYYKSHVDDFTDELIQLSYTMNDSKDSFQVVTHGASGYSWIINMGGMYCSSKSKKGIPVLFRVDKNEVLTVIMHPKEDDRTELILKPNSNDLDSIIVYLLELMDGATLKVRVEDPECKNEYNVRRDMEFSLSGSQEILTPILKTVAEAIGIKD